MSPRNAFFYADSVAQYRAPARDEAAFSLSTWDELPPPGSLSSVALGNLANDLSMVQLRRFLHRACHLLEVGGTWEMVARHPDIGRAQQPLWPGERFADGGRYRPLRHFVELARLFPCELRLPVPIDADRIRVVGERIGDAARVHRAQGEADEKYGPQSDYRRFDRLEEPEIVDDLLYGLSRLPLSERSRVLAVGVNDGRELKLIDEVLRGSRVDAPALWGIDVSQSAIDAARESFPDEKHRFLCADVADLPGLNLPQFDVVLLLGVLQCTTVDRDSLLRDLKPHLAPGCGMLVSIPNCHFGERDILRRPLRRNDPRQDRSLVSKDLRFLTRWCYRSGFAHVETFGTYDSFLLGLRAGAD